MGFKCQDYDPLSAPFSAALSRIYDFVLCNDVVEHFHDPAVEFDLLEDLVRPGGWLLITTREREETSLTSLNEGQDSLAVASYQPDTWRCVGSDRHWETVVQDGGQSLFRMPGYAASD